MESKIVTCVSYHHFEATPSQFTRHLRISTAPEAFARQLDYFKSAYTPISLDQLLDGPLPRNPLLITIDDAYRSVHDIAAPMLDAAKIPALLLTNPAVVASDYVPIDNLLSLAMAEFGATGLGIAVGMANPWTCNLQRIVLDVLPRLSIAGRQDLKRRLLRLLGVNEAELAKRMDLFLDETQLKSLVTTRRFSLGNHTVSHMHLRALSAAEAHAEIVGGRQQLEAMTGAAIRSFSFPYGNRLDATAANLDIVRGSGHEAIFLVQRRTNVLRPAPDIWYRHGMTGEHGMGLPVKLTWLARMGELKAALN